MSDAAELALRTLQAFEIERPQAARLAEIASIGVTIDANLLRRLRTTLLPWVDVGAEAHLWFSDLVESRGPDVAVLDRDVATLLGERLARDQTLLERVMRITAEAHAGEPETIQAEERINGLALSRAPEAGAEIDRELERALRALDAALPQAREIARWVARAAPRFHPMVRQRPKAQMLELIASLVLGDQRLSDEPGAVPVPLDDLGWGVPPAALANPTMVGIDLLEDGVLFHVPARGDDALPVPGTDPLLATLGWRAGDRDLQRTVAIADRKFVPLEGSPREVVITTLAGERHRLVAGEPAETAPATKNAPFTPRPAERPAEVAVPCRRVGISPSDGPTAFPIRPDLWVTAARPFLGTADPGELIGSGAALRVRAQRRRADARQRMAALTEDFEVVGPAEQDSEVLLLKPRAPAEPGPQTGAAPPAGEMRVSVVGYQDGRFEAESGVARVIDEGSRLRVTLDGTDLAGWQRRFLGGPVLAGSDVVGMVVSGPWRTIDARELHALPAWVIAQEIARLEPSPAQTVTPGPREPAPNAPPSTTGHKRLVLCFDDGWEKPSNVRRLFEATAAQRHGTAQVKWQGVGPPTLVQRVTGGVFGVREGTRLKAGYAWLAEQLVDGDEVYLFGFSQGALVCRGLTGMIARCGLVRDPNPELVDQAYELYLSRSDPSARRADEFRERHSRRIPVKFVGVWETVGMPAAGGLHDTTLAAIVENAYHALAVDEHREEVAPTLWDGPLRPGQRLEQRWFAGSHEDVGGGDTGGLGDISLAWMQRKALEQGLAFETTPPTGGDPLAPLHDPSSPDGRRYYRPIGGTEHGNEVVDESVLVRMKEMEDYRPRNVIDYLERQRRSSPA